LLLASAIPSLDRSYTSAAARPPSLRSGRGPAVPQARLCEPHRVLGAVADVLAQQRYAHPAEVQPLDRAALHPHAGTAVLRPLDASQRVEIVERPAGAVPVGEGEEQQPGHADEYGTEHAALNDLASVCPDQTVTYTPAT
jgi:hypothetical protein